MGSTAAVGGIKGVDIGVEEVLLHGLLPMAGDANIAGDQRGQPRGQSELAHPYPDASRDNHEGEREQTDLVHALHSLRGQVHCLLTQAGVKAHVTDLLAMPEP